MEMGQRPFQLFQILACGLALASGCGQPAQVCTINVDEFQSDKTTNAENSTYSIYTATPLTAYAGDRLAQSFQVSGATSVSKISLKMKRTGSPSSGSTVLLYIETNSGNNPSGTEVSANSYASLATSSISSTENTWTEFSFASTISLAANTTYWLVAKGNYSASDTDYITWLANTSNLLSTGQGKVDTGGSCTGTACWTLPAAGAGLDFQMKFGCR